MRPLTIALATVAALGASGAMAADEWGIQHEKKARFEAKVVDVLCELTGDCPSNCGAGKRQLGLLRDDGKLILAAKNFDPFAGAVDDLIDFCGKRIIADGLLIESPKAHLFALQFKRLAPDGEWSRANWFKKRWAEKHGVKPASDKAGEWFRHDARIKAAIAKGGVFGIPGLKPKE
jgi:hypothetical protein